MVLSFTLVMMLACLPAWTGGASAAAHLIAKPTATPAANAIIRRFVPLLMVVFLSVVDLVKP